MSAPAGDARAWSIAIPWRLPGMTLGLVAFVCAGLVAFPVLLLTMLPSAPGSARGTSLGTVLGVAFVAIVALGAVYMMVARYLNRTVVALAEEAVTVRIGPLPWPGRRRVALAEVVAVSVREREERRRVGTVTRWDVVATLKGGGTVALARGLRSHQAGAAHSVAEALSAEVGARGLSPGGPRESWVQIAKS